MLILYYITYILTCNIDLYYAFCISAYITLSFVMFVCVGDYIVII
jgi:hypothetical protein